MTKAELETYIYANMSNVRSPSVDMAKKLSDNVWLVYGTLLIEDGGNQWPLIDEIMANVFKNTV